MIFMKVCLFPIIVWFLSLDWTSVMHIKRGKGFSPWTQGLFLLRPVAWLPPGTFPHQWVGEGHQHTPSSEFCQWPSR